MNRERVRRLAGNIGARGGQRTVGGIPDPRTREAGRAERTGGPGDGRWDGRRPTRPTPRAGSRTAG